MEKNEVIDTIQRAMKIITDYCPDDFGLHADCNTELDFCNCIPCWHNATKGEK